MFTPSAEESGEAGAQKTSVHEEQATVPAGDQAAMDTKPEPTDPQSQETDCGSALHSLKGFFQVFPQLCKREAITQQKSTLTRRKQTKAISVSEHLCEKQPQTR